MRRAWEGTNILCKLHRQPTTVGVGTDRHSHAMWFDKVNDSKGIFSQLSQEVEEECGSTTCATPFLSYIDCWEGDK